MCAFDNQIIEVIFSAGAKAGSDISNTQIGTIICNIIEIKLVRESLIIGCP
jgi:hypothetical protein